LISGGLVGVDGVQLVGGLSLSTKDDVAESIDMFIRAAHLGPVLNSVGRGCEWARRARRSTFSVRSALCNNDCRLEVVVVPRDGGRRGSPSIRSDPVHRQCRKYVECSTGGGGCKEVYRVCERVPAAAAQTDTHRGELLESVDMQMLAMCRHDQPVDQKGID
jgi:hypothetical protein